MRKYFFIVLFGIFLSISNNTLAAQEQTQSMNVLTLSVDQYSDQISRAELEKWLKNNNTFSFSEKFSSEIENPAYCPINKLFCDLTITKTRLQNLHLSPVVTVNTQAIQAYLEDLARKTNHDPVEAKFKIENGVVTSFGESQDGIMLDTEKSTQEIIAFLNNNQFEVPQQISLPYERTKLSTDYGDTNNLGISSLIGEGKSNFKGSPKNRVFNIKVAADRFNGLLIKPGEDFSFVKNLGEVDAEHGYLPELVIKNNVTEPEFGGGICQVSSTAFRAAIYSGLKITARRNHAYPVSYYNPQGMDSTVYIPNPDLRFINNTPNYILIQTRIVGTELTFDFYGTDDGRKTVVDGPFITEKQPDGALKAQFRQTVINKDGKEVINDIFKSVYSSPYKYPHLGGPVLAAKPSNWSSDEWKNYQKTLKDMAKAAVNSKQ